MRLNAFLLLNIYCFIIDFCNLLDIYKMLSKMLATECVVAWTNFEDRADDDMPDPR